MAARRIPPHLKLLTGTARPDREPPPLPPLPPVDSLAPPPWLRDLHALEEWRRLAPALTANKLLHAGNYGIFAQMCALHGHLVAAWTGGSPPSAAMIGQYRKALSELTAGVRALAAAPAVRNNRFQNNGKFK
jgi:hypothetical protein